MIRGHTPLYNNGTDHSIARWFVLSPEPPAGVTLDVVLRYAVPELNGHSGNTLSLFRGDTPEGPWTVMPGEADAQALTVGATWSGPWGPITAFPQDITTSIPAQRYAGYTVWPTPTTGVLWIRGRDDRPVERIEVLDATGRLVPTPSAPPSAMVRLSLAGLPSGLYLLRVNGEQVLRVVKE